MTEEKILQVYYDVVESLEYLCQGLPDEMKEDIIGDITVWFFEKLQREDAPDYWLSSIKSRATHNAFDLAVSRYVDYYSTEVSGLTEEEILDQLEPTVIILGTDDLVFRYSVLPTINEVLDTLSPRRRDVIRLWFGLDGDPVNTNAIAEKYGLSRGRAHQIKMNALAMLRHPSRAKRLVDFADVDRHSKKTPDHTVREKELEREEKFSLLYAESHRADNETLREHCGFSSPSVPEVDNTRSYNPVPEMDPTLKEIFQTLHDKGILKSSITFSSNFTN